MPSQIKDFAEWFKARRTTVEKWYRDDVGNYAFRVTVDGTTLICAARSAASDGRTSVMSKVAGAAQVNNALLCLRVGDTIHVFDPTTVLAHGDTSDPVEDSRKKRGEMWVYFDLGLSASFRDWYDGHAAPVEYAGVEDF